MATVLVPGTKLTVFAIRKTEKGPSVWMRAGNGCVNRDASLNLWLDALPLDGQLHVREAVTGRREAAPPMIAIPPQEEPAAAEPEPVAAAGGQS
jgi:hypothetical protein